MSPETVSKLNKLNNDFYENIGQHFNQSRSNPWNGWERLRVILNSLQPKTDEGLQVLELGCGNGRFLDYLNDNNFDISKYIGLDLSDFLLEKANARLEHLSQVKAEFIKSDILFDEWDVNTKIVKSQYNLVCLFGVMHHIPDRNFRRQLLSRAANCLALSGLLVFTTWQYLDVPRLSRRVLSRESKQVKDIATKYNFDLKEFEIGDNILDWHKGKVAYRFSHYYTEEEVLNLTSSLNLELVTSYQADGKEGNVNKYYIMKKTRI